MTEIKQNTTTWLNLTDTVNWERIFFFHTLPTKTNKLVSSGAKRLFQNVLCKALRIPECLNFNGPAEGVSLTAQDQYWKFPLQQSSCDTTKRWKFLYWWAIVGDSHLEWWNTFNYRLTANMDPDGLFFHAHA